MQAYIDAFERCYPGGRVVIKPAKDQCYWVIIDGSKGDRPLTVDQLREATRMLNRGR